MATTVIVSEPVNGLSISILPDGFLGASSGVRAELFKQNRRSLVSEIPKTALPEMIEFGHFDITFSAPALITHMPAKTFRPSVGKSLHDT